MEKVFNCAVCSSKTSPLFSQGEFLYVRCPQCHHVSTTPYPTASQIKQHYSEGFQKGNYQVARKYSDIYVSNMNKFMSLVESSLRKRSTSIKDISVLDMGCFTGDFLCKMDIFVPNIDHAVLQQYRVEFA